MGYLSILGLFGCWAWKIWQLFQILSEKMRNIVGRFRTRATKVRRRLEAPPSPDDVDMSDDANDPNDATQQNTE